MANSPWPDTRQMMEFLVSLVRPEPPELKSTGRAPGEASAVDRIRDAINLGGEIAMLASVGGKGKGGGAIRDALRHSRGGASAESIARGAAGDRFFRIDPSGKVTPLIQNAEDAALRSTPGAVVKVTPTGRAVEGGALRNKAMQDAFDALKAGGVRDVSPGKVTDLTKTGGVDDNLEFLRKLGIIFKKKP